MYITRRYYTEKHPMREWYEMLTGEKSTQELREFGSAATVTNWYDELPGEYKDVFDADREYAKLNEFFEKWKELYKQKRSSLYHSYEIPKENGKTRRIDEPCWDLQCALQELENILVRDFGAMYHTSAFAYVKNRSTKMCLKRHISSDWFMKTDFHDFFGSTTIIEAMNILSLLFPFNVYFEDVERKKQFGRILSLAFYRGGLPQGTTISPMLTNLLMIPFDSEISKIMRKYSIVYTRYADDCLFSCKWHFETKLILESIGKTLRKFYYPYKLNQDKTRYGGSKGHNWNLGLMLNASHKITIGHEAKRRLKADIFRLLKDSRRRELTKEWVLSFIGRYHYYSSIEPEYVETIFYRLSYRTGWWRPPEQVFSYILKYGCHD